jgi:hypothetical protein
MKFLRALSLTLATLGHFWQDKLNGQIFRYNLLLIILQFGLLLYKFDSLPPQVPLYYSRPYDESQLATTSSLFLLPIFSVSISATNNLISAFLLRSSHLLARLSLIFSLIFSLLSLITLFQIIQLIS